MDYDIVDSSQPGLRAIEPSGAQANRERLEGKRKFRVNAKDSNNRDLMTRQVFTTIILFCFVFQAGNLSSKCNDRITALKKSCMAGRNIGKIFILKPTRLLLFFVVLRCFFLQILNLSQSGNSSHVNLPCNLRHNHKHGYRVFKVMLGLRFGWFSQFFLLVFSWFPQNIARYFKDLSLFSKMFLAALGYFFFSKMILNVFFPIRCLFTDTKEEVSFRR